ncbi:hypothetical protein [Ruania zhangjianzhongii]|uniref:hypothetical protein n=1 Tax=Ruania zhangjianzhongii TaxID=2603206 RepID=UPI0011C81D98|nr:hypothetical protein [Ruania zhangjianzhongii]
MAVLALAGCGGAGSATSDAPEEDAPAASAPAEDASAEQNEDSGDESGEDSGDVGLSSEGHTATEGPAYTVLTDDDYRTVLTVSADQLAELTQVEVTEDSVADVLAALTEAATYAEHAEIAEYADELAGTADERSDQLTELITGLADGSVAGVRISVSHAVENVSVNFGSA